MASMTWEVGCRSLGTALLLAWLQQQSQPVGWQCPRLAEDGKRQNFCSWSSENDRSKVQCREESAWAGEVTVMDSPYSTEIYLLGKSEKWVLRWPVSR